MQTSVPWAKKIADVSRHHHWFSREMTSEGQTQKFHSDDVSLASHAGVFRGVRFFLGGMRDELP